MIKVNNFTYIHPLKCGGTFVNEILDNTDEPEYLGYHLPRSKVTGEHTFVASVRNPFDWYVSFYHHSVEKRGYIFECNDDFKTTLISLLSLRDSNLYEGMLNHDWVGDCASYITKSDIADYPSDVGFYTWNWNRMVADTNGNTEDVHVIKTETLRDDLVNTFSKFGKITDNIKSLIMSTPDANVQKDRKPYQEYYDDELIALVYKADKVMFDRFGYAF